MPAPEVENPIINSPYEEPTSDWKIHEHEPAEKISGRREQTCTYLAAWDRIHWVMKGIDHRGCALMVVRNWAEDT